MNSLTQPLNEADPYHPPDHPVGVKVPEDGARCSNCEFVSEDQKRCSNSYFQRWNHDQGAGDSGALPETSDRYCCDNWTEDAGS